MVLLHLLFRRNWREIKVLSDFRRKTFIYNNHVFKDFGGIPNCWPWYMNEWIPVPWLN